MIVQCSIVASNYVHILILEPVKESPHMEKWAKLAMLQFVTGVGTNEHHC